MEHYRIDHCPVSVTQIAHSRWTYLLLVELAKGTTSFGRLKKALHPVTSKTLASCIRRAVGASLILKHGPHYELNTRGKQVLNTLRTLSAGAPECTRCPGAAVCKESL